MKSSKNKLLRRKNILLYKKKYSAVNEIFRNYLFFQNKLKKQNFFNVLEINFWNWYINEIEIVLKILKKTEQEFLVNHFLKGKPKDEMFISKSKYYAFMNASTINFLNNLDKNVWQQKIYKKKCI